MTAGPLPTPRRYPWAARYEYEVSSSTAETTPAAGTISIQINEPPAVTMPLRAQDVALSVTEGDSVSGRMAVDPAAPGAGAPYTWAVSNAPTGFTSSSNDPGIYLRPSNSPRPGASTPSLTPSPTALARPPAPTSASPSMLAPLGKHWKSTARRGLTSSSIKASPTTPSGVFATPLAH